MLDDGTAWISGRERKLKDALGDRRQAEARIHAVLAEHYPVGTSLTWRIRGRLYHGRVIDVYLYDRLRVHNDKTGKGRDIHAYDIVSAMPGGDR